MNLEEVARLRLEILGDEAQKTVQNLESGLRDVNSELRLMELNGEKGSDAWKELKKVQADVKDEIKDLTKALDINDASWRELSSLSKQLGRDLANLKIGSEEWVDKLKEIAQVEDRMKDVRSEMRKIKDEGEDQKGFWDTFKGTFFGAFAADMLMQAGQAIWDFGKKAIQTAAEYSDSFADIQKTTGQTNAEVRELNEQLQGINTRTAQLDLLNIAQVGGQIGIAKEEMFGFVDAIDKAVVALGDEFSGGAEQVAKEMGVLANLFKETKDLEAGEAILRIGSAVNELGAAGLATGPYLSDFTARLGALGDLAPKVTESLAFGSIFEELGLTSEIAASGLTKVLTVGATESEKFARGMNLAKSEVENLINTNPNEFILKLAESFEGLSTTEVAAKMKDLGLNSQEAIKVMGVLAENTDLVREKQELSSKAFQEATSLTNEFNIKNETFAATLDKAGKAVEELEVSLGQVLIPIVTTLVTSFVALLKGIGAIPEFVRENKEMFIALGVALVGLNTANIAATASSLAHAAAEKGRLIWTEAATVAQWAMNIALNANPIGAVVAAISVLVGGFITLYQNSETLRNIIDGVWAAMKEGVEIIQDVAQAIGRGFDQMLEKLPFLTEGLEWIGDVSDTILTALGDSLSWVGSKIGQVIDFFGGLYSKIFEVGNSIGGALSPAFDFILNGFDFVKKSITDFLNFIQGGVEKVSGFLKSITPEGFTEAGKLFSDAGKRISKSFNDAFASEQEEGHKQQSALNKKQLDKKVEDEKKASGIITENDKQTHQKGLSEKGNANKKANDERIKANEDALKSIAKLEVTAIADDLKRNIANENAKYAEEKKRIEKSKADAVLKAKWLEALEKEHTAKIEKINGDFRTKKEKADQQTAQKIDAMEAKYQADDLKRKIASIEASAKKDLEEAQKLVKDKDQLAKLEVAINTKKEQDIAATRDKFRKETEVKEKAARDLKLKEEKSLFDSEFKAFQAKTEAQLANTREGSNAQLQVKINSLTQEYEYRKRKLLMEAADEKARLAESIKDSDARAAAIKNIDDRLTSQLKTNDANLQAEKTRLLAEQHQNRLTNTTQFFNALEGLAKGDFNSFTNFLLQKVSNEQAANQTRLRDFATKGAETLEIAGQVVQGMQQLNQAFLESQLRKIEREKNSQLASWEEQYKSGKISKIEYQVGVDRINAQAAEKERAEKLKAWKRDQAMQIGMAIINAAAAALKSLATMGWPLGLIGVAASAVTAGIQIAMIKKQQPPSFADGGTLPGKKYVRNAGVPEGPGHGSSYGKSGIALVRRDTQQEVGEMEGDEPIMILSRNTYKNNRGTIDKLLHSSLHRNGAPIFARNGAWLGDAPIEPLGYGQSYLFGSKKKKKAYDAQMQAQYDADQAAKNGTTAGGYEDYAYEDYNYDDGGAGGDYGDYGDYGGSADYGDASATNATTSAQIRESQLMMENIAKNTAQTVGAIKELAGKIDQSNSLLNDIRNKPIGPSLHEIQGAVASATANSAKSDL
ncbi:phage tail tape measure protein [Arundinibacter roseus]|uniref:Phage tail tape measure protein n=1 Tax=Arundinibacter roseus TaxID=2070510 RepID=A0A4R4KDF0_9BACT|nr:phage tail tape measure protein [Arundinibacter roseus]TDB64369.1 phage tail tape measure protein [Arundinibacter roseus]